MAALKARLSELESECARLPTLPPTHPHNDHASSTGRRSKHHAAVADETEHRAGASNSASGRPTGNEETASAASADTDSSYLQVSPLPGLANPSGGVAATAGSQNSSMRESSWAMVASATGSRISSMNSFNDVTATSISASGNTGSSSSSDPEGEESDRRGDDSPQPATARRDSATEEMAQFSSAPSSDSLLFISQVSERMCLVWCNTCCKSVSNVLG